jgi:peptidyl-Lys metalloendopeptidase
MFSIVNELGVSPSYSGIFMKRRLAYEDVITLQPGQTVTATVDLQKGYYFDQQGKFFVNLQSYIYLFNGEEFTMENLLHGIDDFTLFDLTSDEILPITVLEVSEMPEFMKKSEIGDGQLGQVLATNGCPTANQTAICTADTNALNLTNRVTSYLSGSCPSGTPAQSKFVNWMGACDTNRFTAVRNNFNAIGNRIRSGYRVDCAGRECSPNVYAYVYPTDTQFWVYVCGAFWSASGSTCAWDSRPGTIVHEISHFNAVAGTRDVAYGRANCEALARNNPSDAVRNADSHEYLAESCP